MIIYNSINKKYKTASVKEAEMILNIGILYWLREQAIKLENKERSILQYTFEKYKRKRNRALKATYEETSKKTLLDLTGKFIFKVSKELDSLIFVVFDYTGFFLRKDNLSTDLTNLIEELKSGNTKPKQINTSISILDASVKVPVELVQKQKKKERQSRRIQDIEDKPSKSYVDEVYKIKYNVQRDMEFYYGTTFPLSDENLGILRMFRESLLTVN